MAKVEKSNLKSDEEKWIFSLTLPSTKNSNSRRTSTSTSEQQQERSIELISTHFDDVNGKLFHTTHRKKELELELSHSSASSSETGAAEDANKSSETKSLLDNHEFDEVDDNDGIIIRDLEETTDSDSNSHCWKFYSPVHGLALQSSSLLRLSYRPAWQSIPEFTNGKRQRAFTRSFTSCCCPTDGRLEEEQIWEVYTTNHITRQRS